jgi:hypothetical protein
MSDTHPAVVEERDQWGRVVIKLESGVRLCDINCQPVDVLQADPSLGDWHTMTPDLGEPECRFKGKIELE